MAAITQKSKALTRGTQHWDPDRYARNARFVSDLGAPVLDLLAPAAGERVLDLGCGDGALTEKLVQGGVRAVGVDASPDQVEAARRRGLDAHVMDATRLAFAAEFDAVFSNATLHWVKDADAAIAGVFRALKPGGRFVGEMGGKGNIVAIMAALKEALSRRGIDAARLDPWYFPDEAEYGGKLERAGFTVRAIALIPRMTPLPGALGAWVETFCESFLAAVADDERTALIADVEAAARPVLRDPNGGWRADYVRLRFSALKPAGREP